LAGLRSAHVHCAFLRVDYMKVLSIAAVLATLTLGGCCLSFSGCEAPLATARSDWDGLVPPRAEDAPSSAPTEKTSGRANSQGEQSKTAYSGSTTGSSWKDDDARLQMDDARLKQKLIICDGCAVPRN
jgi:hypothetical protein